MTRSVLTIATGKPVYLELAINLARSFFCWNKESDIGFQLATDMGNQIPSDLQRKVQIVPITQGQYGSAFSPKLFLDQLAICDKTLFIDSDCLIFGNLDNVFQKFDGHSVSVTGGYIGKGEWFGNVETICRKFNIPHMPKFNGGIYYLEKGPVANQIYQTARDLEKQYDEIGFIPLRNNPNDEVLMALAMQLHNQTPVPDDGTILSDPLACPGSYQIDVLNGKRKLFNPPAPHKLHQPWYPFTQVSPVVVHFLGSHTHDYRYQREAYKLKNAGGRWNAITNIAAWGMIEAPARSKIFFKDILRPFYRLLFGIRAIKTSDRL